MNLKAFISVSAMVAVASAAHAADTLAGWTFESLPTSPTPVTAGPYNAESGTGSALGFHATTSTYSSPAGNGSAKSFSSNGWSVGDYYQFKASTVGYEKIGISFDQTGSATGPASFGLSYSTDGTNFTQFAKYTVLLNGATGLLSWSPANGVQSGYHNSFDLSSVTALNGKSTVTFRLIDLSTTSINGGTVASGGTDRVDNVTITGTQAVPEPASMVALGVGVAAMVRRRRSAK